MPVHYSNSERHELLLPMRRWWHSRMKRLGVKMSATVTLELGGGDEWVGFSCRLCAECDLLEIFDWQGVVLWSKVQLLQTTGFPTWWHKPQEMMMSFLKKKIDSGDLTKPVLTEQSALSKQLPAMLEYLVTDSWPDGGGERKTSTVTISVEAGAWKASLNDRDGNRSTFVTASTLEGALKALEARLKADDVEWRDWTSNYKAKGQKGKK